MSTTVLLVDDQTLVRAGFRRLLDAEPDIDVLAEAGNGADAVEAAVRLRPHVALLDIRMPTMDGIEATRRIVADTDTRVVILTTFDLDEYVYDALRGGASGFLLKDSPPDQMITAIHAAAAGDGVEIFPGGPPARFTQRLDVGTYYAGSLPEDLHHMPTIHVSGPAAPATSPTTAATITALDSGFTESTHTVPHAGNVLLRSRGHQPHFLILSPIAAGTTRAELGAYLRRTGASENAPPPSFARNGSSVGTGILSPGTQMVFGYDMPAGGVRDVQLLPRPRPRRRTPGSGRPLRRDHPQIGPTGRTTSANSGVADDFCVPLKDRYPVLRSP